MVKVIDEYRQKCQEYRELFTNNGFLPNSAELACIVLESLAFARSTELYFEVDEEVRRMVLRDLRRFKRTGKRELIFVHANRYKDGRAEAQAAIATLAAKGLVPQSMTQPCKPAPLFVGLEKINGGQPLIERLTCDDSLLNVELVGIAQKVPNPIAYPHSWTMSLHITEHERHQTDEIYYERRAVRSCVATLSLNDRISMYFWPSFRFGYLSYLHIRQESRPRGQTALSIKLGLSGEKGRIYCRDLELIGLEEINLSGLR